MPCIDPSGGPIITDPPQEEPSTSYALHHSFEYDANDNLTRWSDMVDSAYNLSMTYDGLDRLDTVTDSYMGTGSVNYDTMGNITSYSMGNRSMTYTYDSSKKLASVSGYKNYSFSYDGRGNITGNGMRTFDYNLAGQMHASGTNRYVYDGANMRVKTQDANGETFSVFGINGKLMYRLEDGQHSDYYYLGTKEIAKRKGSRVTYVHTDYLGTPAAETNGDGMLIARMHSMPFGESIQAPRNDTGYTGHEFDTDLGLNYMQARYYDPVIGRFYANDPVGYELDNPIMSFNRYLYVNNNPFKFVDPDGRKLRFAKGSSPTFKKQFASIIKYHNKAGTSGVFARLEKRSEVVTIKEGTNHRFGFSPKTDTITFDPTSGLEVAPGQVQTPALGVLHEAGHAEEHLVNPTQEERDYTTPDAQYDNIAEKKVIQNRETPAAKKLNEPTRSSHGGKAVRVKCPTCDS